MCVCVREIKEGRVVETGGKGKELVCLCVTVRERQGGGKGGERGGR